MIELSPIDYYFYRPDLFTIQFVFEYNCLVTAEMIRAGLNSLPSSFDPAKMVLSQKNQQTLCLVSNHEVEIPITEIPCSEEIDLNRQDHLKKLVSPVTNEIGKPLVRFQLNQWTNRTLVGVSFSHILGDGFSFILFLRALARSCRGLNPDLLPSHDRFTMEPGPTMVKPDALKEIFSDTGFNYEPLPAEGTLRHETLFFSREDLQEIRQGFDTSKVPKVSDNDVIMASLLKRFHSRLPLTEANQIALRCPVDLRNVFPTISKTYFGNCIKDAMCVFDPKTISNISLEEIILKIRASIRGIDAPLVNRYLNSLSNVRKQNGIDIFKNVGCPGLLVTNLSRLPFFEIDFGPGAPIGFYTYTPCPRLAVILPDPDGFKVSAYMPI